MSTFALATRIPLIPRLCTLKATVPYSSSVLYGRVVNQFRSREARKQWIDGISGALDLGAAGAKTAVTTAALAGRKVGAISQQTLDALSIGSVTMKGIKVANNVVDRIQTLKDGDRIVVKEVMQMSADLGLYAHNIRSFRLASTIIDEAAAKRIGQFLKEHHRRSFENFIDMTKHMNVDTTRKTLDTMRWFADQGLLKLHKFGTAALALELIRNRTFSMGEHAEIIFKHAVNSDIFINFIQELSPKVFFLIVELTCTFIGTMLGDVTSALGVFIPPELILVQIIIVVMIYFPDITYEFIESHADDILAEVKRYLLSFKPMNHVNINM